MEGDSQEAFDISPGREDHCSIQVDEDTVVLTGGKDVHSLVTEYSGISSGQVTSRTLPDLLTGRYYHACGSYTLEGEMVLLITGGFLGHYLSTTEVLSHPDGQAWREVGRLPSGRRGLVGASLGGVFHVTGGTNGVDLDDVLAWDPVEETWSQTGKLDEPRSFHAITELPMEAIENFCSLIL